MLKNSQIAPFVATAEPERARKFYEETLGLALISDDEHALVFDANGITLRIQKVRDVAPIPYTTLGWHVDDIEATVSELSGRGVGFETYEGFGQDARGIMTFPNGARVAWFKDPDGNLLSLDQQ
jgi:catechol 2,3-dioxygenase-like lactoylglutathione lyase family enzyme